MGLIWCALDIPGWRWSHSQGGNFSIAWGDWEAVGEVGGNASCGGLIMRIYVMRTVLRSVPDNGLQFSLGGGSITVMAVWKDVSNLGSCRFVRDVPWLWRRIRAGGAGRGWRIGLVIWWITLRQSIWSTWTGQAIRTALSTYKKIGSYLYLILIYWVSRLVYLVWSE